MDISLPGASGIEVARAIRESRRRWAGVPVVAMSAHVSATLFEQFAAPGIAGFSRQALRPRRTRARPSPRRRPGRARWSGRGTATRWRGGRQLAGDFAPTGGGCADRRGLPRRRTREPRRTHVRAPARPLPREATAAFVEFEHSVARSGDRDALAKRAHRPPARRQPRFSRGSVRHRSGSKSPRATRRATRRTLNM